MNTALVIDDDPIVLKVIAQSLAEAGWKVSQAASGEEGLRLARDGHPEVIICDLLMPRINGYQLCRQIRADVNYLPQPRLIVISSSNYAADKESAVAAGADDFLLKPVKPAELLHVISQESGTTFFYRKSDFAERGPSDTTWFSGAIGRQTRVKFWGVRGSIPSPGPHTVKYGGNTSCVEVRADGELIVLDAGSGIRQLGRSLIGEFKGKPMRLSVLVSHTHWDHIQGFPFFIPAYDPKNEITVMGYEGARQGLQRTLSSQMESPYFPITLQQMPSTLQITDVGDTDFHLGKVRVQTTFLNHPGVCIGYRLNTSAGSVVYLADNEPHSRLRMAPMTDSVQSYEVLSYAQKQDEKLIEFVRDADVLIMDAQYDANEYQSHIGWGHGCVDDVVAIGVIARVKKLFLFHHDPDHDDAMIEKMEEWARELVAIHGGETEVAAAREGLEVVLEPARPA